MILKSVDLQGFKSFPEKTTIEFSEGITAIIGPNGSGKSNISDAVRWVLGEMSLKTLRGSKMEDVIFNGANGVAPATFASVSLCIDTQQEYEKSQSGPATEETDEIKSTRIYSLGDDVQTTVTRKLYRSGESEYYINKKLVRLKDIYELFYDTGIGREGYSVIGQGKIAEVLSRKDEERRGIFEEAAGISKYRYKKNETERKLQSTEANLVRINDILSEIKTRVVPLEKEAENAKQYLLLSEEKKGLEITLWLDRIDSVRERLKLNEQHTAAAELRYNTLTDTLAALEARLDKTINQSHEMTKNHAEGERQAAALEREMLAYDSGNSVNEAEIRHLNSQKLQSEEAIKADAEQLSALEAERAALALEAEAAAAELERLEAEYRLLDSGYLSEKQKTEASQAEYEQATAEERRLNAEITEKSLEKASLEAKIQAGASNVNERRQKLSELEKEVLAINSESETVKQSVDDAEARLKSAEAEKLEAENKIVKAQALVGTCREGVNALRLTLNAAEQKRDNLERMERLLEGYSDSVKTLLTAAKEFKLRSTVYGTVSSIISTTDEYVIAVETALGAGVQNIVVGDESDAKACIEYLKRTHAGRATFLPVSTINGRRADISAIKSMNGFVGLACEVVSTDHMFAKIAEDLLGRTVIADNIDNASLIARACGYRIKIVTLDGQVINAGGSYTGGTAIKKTGIMTRTLDIERLTETINKENEKLLEAEMALRRAEKEVDRATEAAAQAAERSSEAKVEQAKAISELFALAQRLESKKSEQEQLRASYDEELRRSTDAETKLNSISEYMETLKKEQEKASDKLEKLREQAQIKDEKEKETLETLTVGRLALRDAENALERYELKMSLLDRNKAAAEAQIANNTASIARFNEDICRLNRTIDKASTDKALLSAKLEELKREQLKLSGELSEKQLSVDKIRAEIRTHTSEKEEAFVELTGAKSKSESQGAELDSVSGKLWDEYELTYSDALEFRLPEDKMDKAASRLATLKSKIRSLGVINVNAVEEYRATKERYDFLSAQVADLEKTKRSLAYTIDKLNVTMKDTFMECFGRINSAFGEVFTELFGGGSAYVCLTEPDEPLTSGIEIIVRPPGKTVKSISLLSGGEQSFAAMALYLALQKINPAPFCIFDEIESALDEINVNRFADYVKAHSANTQYILITHRRGTMECADTLYGVTMQRRGISEYLKIDADKIQFELK